MPWYPASLTKLMTTYVTLQAVKNRRHHARHAAHCFARAQHAQQPSKIGFKPGTQVTVDNALKMLMVKSANDIAVVLAEGVSGSVENFADEMNQHEQELGMTQSSWVNPNGLPAEDQITSARDLAILARALIHDFPEYDMYWHIPAIQFGKRVMRNYNTLIGRYDGADGMKTGFICASGFNLVATATRNGKRLDRRRARRTVVALSRGEGRGPAGARLPSRPAGLADAVARLGRMRCQPINAAPPDLRDEMCGPHRKRPAAEEADDDSTDTGSDSESMSCFPACRRAATSPRRCSATQPAAASRSPSSSAPRRTPPKPVRQSRAQGSPSGKLAKVKAAADAGRTPRRAAGRAYRHRDTPTPAADRPSPPAGAFTPPPAEPQRGPQRAAGAPTCSNPSVMSFAPAARADPAPLTAMPDAKPEPSHDRLAAKTKPRHGQKRRPPPACRAHRSREPKPAKRHQAAHQASGGFASQKQPPRRAAAPRRTCEAARTRFDARQGRHVWPTGRCWARSKSLPCVLHPGPGHRRRKARA